MEFLFSYFVSFLMLLLAVLLYFLVGRPINVSSKLPPGKMGWPIIGESIEYLSLGWKGIPEKFVRDRMERYSNKVFKTSLFFENMAIFVGAEGHKFLFTNENKLVTSWWPSSINKVFPSIAETDLKHEGKMLQSYLPAVLKPEALQKYIPIMDTMSKKHLETEWLPNREVKVFHVSKKYTFSLACRLFLSIEDPEHVTKLADPFSILISGTLSLPIDLPGTPFNRAIRGANFIRKELMKIIKQRKIDLAEKRATATQDILSRMLHVTNEDGTFLKELVIADRILGLLIAGHDTASSVLTFILKYLAEHPEFYDHVYREQMEIAASKGPGELLNWTDIQKMKYSWNVACETMRLAPPAAGAFKEAITDISYGNYLIPKGWKIFWNVNTTHKNPAYFPNPEKFDPSRFEGNGPAPYSFTPFGGGPRMCPGKEYARLETLVFMHNLVKMFKWEQLVPDEKIIYNPGPVPEEGLPIRLYPLEGF